MSPAPHALAFVLLLATGLGAAPVQSPQGLLDRAEADFASGNVVASLADFDELIALVPSVAPELWQRGIALYELGRYKECAAQFQAHHTVNPTDIENAAWGFFCQARVESPGRARAAIMPAGPDRRIMRTEIYEMVNGRMTPADLVASAEGLPIAQFYAHLYAGLYFDATGDRRAALAQMTEAAADRYSDFGGFMNVVAHVVRDRLRRATSASRLAVLRAS